LRRDAAAEADEADDDDEEDDDNEDDDNEQDIYDAPAYEAVDDDEEGIHPFLVLARKIAAENDGVSKDKSYQLARARRPDLFRSYQRFSREGEVGKSYRQLVDAEIRKGCSPVVAAQRVTYAYPNLAQETLAKSDSGAAHFMRAVDRVMKRDNCGRVEALQKARRENPGAFARFQNV
jgi:hypothetical protein